MNEKLQEKIISSILKNHYTSLYLLECKTQILTQYHCVTMEKEMETEYSQWIHQIASSLNYIEIQPFVDQMDLQTILKNLEEETSHIIYYHTGKNDAAHHYQLAFSYLDDTKQFLVITQQNTSLFMRCQHENLIQLQKDSERFRFVISHLCENFGEINVSTGETWMTTVNDWEVEKGNLKEQIQWFADNLIAPEYREQYIHDFELNHLVDSLRRNGGFYAPTYAAHYPDGTRYLLIISALLSNPLNPTEEYIFSFAQDITQIKREEEKNKQLIDISHKLLAISQMEPVTKLLNRTAGNKMITDYLNSDSLDCSGAFLLIDIDYFKKFNDNYGHAVGDIVLKYMSSSLQDIFHSRDVLCRWGGDEFVVFIHNYSDSEALKKQIEMLQRKMKHHVYKGAPLPITLSIGCVITRQKQSLSDIFNEADKLLYQVKQHGRNHYLIQVL